MDFIRLNYRALSNSAREGLIYIYDLSCYCPTCSYYSMDAVSALVLVGAITSFIH